MRVSKITFILLLVLVTSCDNKVVFDEYKSVSTAWNKEDVVQFKINAPDSISPYNLFVNVRNTNAYKYSNLYLIVEMNFPHGKIVTDTLQYNMTEKNGAWLGEGLSAVKDNKLWYKEGVVFNESGTYNVKIQHAMRGSGEVNGVVNLEGLTDVGFRIEKTE
ncbi:gliding motility lipoprotein GldH [Olleya sp. Bg11-27]|uniref:gliding motility lipoprotein GldH n=1 Tax=Olleya sp. Bg11-27 TaxID=2058135 RepID=UPI000C3093FE|nr:gliding motility lipoprotein GldH [Olleya sp. Bg11-27]AUC74799.1 gliding motility lipoprotein GldH [Olleya sp. Bg11-27]